MEPQQPFSVPDGSVPDEGQNPSVPQPVASNGSVDNEPAFGNENVNANPGIPVPAVMQDGQVQVGGVQDVIEEQEYYHGLLPRDDVTAMLVNKGDFLVRTTEITSGSNRQYCLSVSWAGQTHHFLLAPNERNMYTLEHGIPGSPEFSTIFELVNFHKRTARVFSPHRIVLQNPIYRQEWELRHEQIDSQMKLGEGAFGEVWGGELQLSTTKVQVAIKQMKCSILTKQKIEELMKEARLMRPLRHRNVIRFYGVAAEQEPLLIIMELVSGGALDSYLKTRNIAIQIDERLNMSLDAIMGIEYIHQKGIIHRDIAARNCLYGNHCLKISDFGLSRKTDMVQMDPTEKAPVRWLAPEVFVTQQFRSSADVWAWGVLVWEIFSNGAEPYAGWKGPQIKEQVLGNNYRLPFPEWVPPALTKFVTQQVWVADPNCRIPSGFAAREMERLCPNRVTSGTKPPLPRSQLNLVSRRNQRLRQIGSGEAANNNRSQSTEEPEPRRKLSHEAVTNLSRERLKKGGKFGKSKEALGKSKEAIRKNSEYALKSEASTKPGKKLSKEGITSFLKSKKSSAVKLSREKVSKKQKKKKANDA